MKEEKVHALNKELDDLTFDSKGEEEVRLEYWAGLGFCDMDGPNFEEGREPLVLLCPAERAVVVEREE